MAGNYWTICTGIKITYTIQFQNTLGIYTTAKTEYIIVKLLHIYENYSVGLIPIDYSITNKDIFLFLSSSLRKCPKDERCEKFREVVNY